MSVWRNYKHLSPFLEKATSCFIFSRHEKCIFSIKFKYQFMKFLNFGWKSYKNFQCLCSTPISWDTKSYIIYIISMNALTLCNFGCFQKEPKLHQIKACVPTINMTYGFGVPVWTYGSQLIGLIKEKVQKYMKISGVTFSFTA